MKVMLTKKTTFYISTGEVNGKGVIALCKQGKHKTSERLAYVFKHDRTRIVIDQPESFKSLKGSSHLFMFLREYTACTCDEEFICIHSLWRRLRDEFDVKNLPYKEVIEGRYLKAKKNKKVLQEDLTTFNE